MRNYLDTNTMKTILIKQIIKGKTTHFKYAALLTI